MTTPPNPLPDAPLVDRAARRFVWRGLASAHGGRVALAENGHAPIAIGHPGTDDLHTTVQVHDTRAYRSVLQGSAGVGASYANGHWDADDLTTFLRILVRNTDRLDDLRDRFGFVVNPLLRLRSRLTSNTRRRSRERIAAHYDLSNDLFAAFLDPSMTYSSGIYTRPDSTLEEAQFAKLDRVCQVLDLGPDDHVLEIGTGWGSFAMHAAAHYGARITTTTISKEQRDLALERIRSVGLQDLIDVQLTDYRDLTGTYDKVVSIEMIEAVGWEHLNTYLRVIGERLRPDGAALIQAITIDDRVYEDAKAKTDFIKAHIFPGGFLPSRLAILDAATAASDLRLVQLEDLTSHYARTLRDWHERFERAWPTIEPLGFDDRFRRLWRFYLAYCEAGFLERRIGNAQLLLAKPGYRSERLPTAAPATPRPTPIAEVA